MKKFIAVIVSLIVIINMLAPAVNAGSGPYLSMALAADTPGSRDVVVNDTSVVALKANLTAYGDNLKIQAAKIKFFRIPIENGLITGDAAPAQATDVTNIRLRVNNRIVTLRKQLNAGGSVTFGETDWRTAPTIYKDTTESVEVLFDLPATTTATGLFAKIDGEDILFAFSSGEHTWAVGGAQGTYMAVKQQGFLGVYLSTDTPSKQIATTGSANVVFLKADFIAGSTEDVDITELTVQRYGGEDKDLGSVSLWDGSTQLGDAIYLNDAAVVHFPADSPWRIAKGTIKKLTVRADITSDATNGRMVRIGLYGIKATGKTSGSTTIVPEAFQLILSEPVIIRTASTTIKVTATLDGKPWKGKVIFDLSGNSNFNGMIATGQFSVPTEFENIEDPVVYIRLRDRLKYPSGPEGFVLLNRITANGVTASAPNSLIAKSSVTAVPATFNFEFITAYTPPPPPKAMVKVPTVPRSRYRR